MNSKTITKYVFLFFVFFFLFFFFSDDANAAVERRELCDTGQTCDEHWVGFYNANDGTTWEVRYKIQVDDRGEYPGNYTFSQRVPANTTVTVRIYTPTSWGNDRSDFSIHWATTCVDPYSASVLGFPSLFSGWEKYLYFIGIDPRSAPSSINPIGNGQNLGYVDWTGSSNSFRAGSTAQCIPCNPDYSCNSNECGIKNAGCGKERNCEGCPGELNDCNNSGICVQNYGCRLNDSGNPVCAKKKCNLGSNDCYSTNSCGGGCSGSIEGTVYIDKNEDNNFDSGEGYTRRDPNSEDLTVQRGQISSGNFNLRDERAPNPDYRFGNLLRDSSHDVRVINFFNNRLNLEGDNPRRDVRVPNDNANFRFSFQKSSIRGRVIWDEDGNLATTNDREPYVKPLGKVQRIRIIDAKGNRTDRFDLTNADNGTYSIPGNPTSLADEGRKWIVRLIANDPDYGIRPTHMMVGGKNEIEVFVKGGDVTGKDFYVTHKVNNPDISGTVWLDNPTLGTRNEIDASDTRYTASQVTINLNPSDLLGKTPSNGSGGGTGNYTISNVPPGSYTAVLLPSSLRNGYSTIRDSRTNINVVSDGENITDIDFLVRRGLANTFSISGGIFIDDGDGVKEAGENYVNALGDEITIQGFPAITNSGTSGYSQDVPAGTYTVTLSKTRSGYSRTFPSRSIYTVTAGTGCTGNPAVSCDVDGNVSAVDFGITFNPAQASWYQGVGGDMRSDNGDAVTIPANQYFSITNTNNPALSSPGIIYNFDVNGNKSTPRNWYIASQFRGKSIKTSYAYVSDALKKGNVNPTNPCGASPNCSLENNLNGGYYLINKDISLSAKANTFKSNSDYVFLINGDLSIDSDLNVPQGSTALFVASGNITVGKNVDRIEGVFSTDKIFTVENKTPASETQLIVEGSIIANAIKSSAGTKFFNNKRNLGSDRNETTPAVKIFFRPDFVLNAPDLIRYSNYNFHEAPPGGQ